MLTDDTVVLEAGRRRRSAAKLSLTPLVDCVFILLIFFMLQSNLITPRGMPLRHPPPEPAPTAHDSSERPRVLYVELHADGTLWVDGQQRDPQALPRALAELDLARYESGIVAVDPGVDLQRAVDALDRLGAGGLANVQLREARQFK
jgi:biopolymer transport protein ExbD